MTSDHILWRLWPIFLEILAFLRPMDYRLRLVTSTCAGYDDDAQICCEHGGEGGFLKYVTVFQLTAGVHETTMTSGGGGSGRC